jgi:hypothetical protein
MSLKEVLEKDEREHSSKEVIRHFGLGFLCVTWQTLQFCNFS